MSSFRRKGKQTLSSYPGTHISPASNLSLITSTGISSLDDILGGGLPLSCSLVFAAPDIHSSYGELIEKYFVAQGLAAGHSICLVSENPDGFMRDVMWFTKGQRTKDENESDEDKTTDQAPKVKIAWRYENMKQFQTTVGDSNQDVDSFCQSFELSSRIPEDLIENAIREKRLRFIQVEDVSTAHILGKISRYIEAETSLPMRICIPGLGSAAWGDLGPQTVLHFLHSLRASLRRNGHSCASISLTPQLSTERWGGEGWMEKVGWASDGTVTVSAFSANPGLLNIFPSHHGLVTLHRLPSPLTLSAASDRFSVLRGLGSSGENNLAFKCTRKRMIFETLHLDVEGGTGERRTTASRATRAGEEMKSAPSHDQRIEVEIEEEVVEKKKARKRVVFDF